MFLNLQEEAGGGGGGCKDCELRYYGQHITMYPMP